VIVEKEYNEDEPKFPDTKIIPPVYIGDNVELENCIIGPKASIASGSKLSKCTIKNSLIQENARLEDCNIESSTIGRYAELKNVNQEVHVGDHSKVGVEV
jgi:glucose-1-phosphate thymidylyltransferase